jgi:Transposase DDE domain
VDAHRFSAAQLAGLYFRRWGVELHFRQIKTLLGMDVLRCLSPAMVRKELLMHLVAYNLIRALMQRASLIYHVPLERISFKGTLDSLHHFANAVHAAHTKPNRQRQLCDALLLTIAADQVPHLTHLLFCHHAEKALRARGTRYWAGQKNDIKQSLDVNRCTATRDARFHWLRPVPLRGDSVS